MSSAEPESNTSTELDENVLEEHENLADVILEHGGAYDSIKERRGLDPEYHELDVEEKWDYALQVLHNRGGGRYESPEDLIQDFREDEVLQDGLPWNTSSWADEYRLNGKKEDVTVKKPEATGLDDGRVTARVNAYVEGREDEGFLYRLIESSGNWQEFRQN